MQPSFCKNLYMKLNTWSCLLFSGYLTRIVPATVRPRETKLLSIASQVTNKTQ